MEIGNNDKNEESNCRSLNSSSESDCPPDSEFFYRGCLREDPTILRQNIKRHQAPRCRRKFDWFQQENSIPKPESPTFPILTLDIPLVSVF